MIQAKMRPRVTASWIGQGDGRRQKFTQPMHIVDKDGETLFVFTIEVDDANGLPAGLYNFTESSFAVGDWQAPMFARAIASSLEPVSKAAPSRSAA